MTLEVDWVSHCTGWESSGLSQKDYCTEKGLSYWEFCEQRSQLASRGLVKAVRGSGLKGKRKAQGVEAPSFLPIELRGAGEAESQKWIEIALPHGISLRIPCDVAV